MTTRAINELIALAKIAQARKYPNVPDHCRPNPRYDDRSANALTRSILAWLELNGHYASRIQSQGQYNPTLKRFTQSTVRRGIGDIMAVIEGKTVMIEVKIGADKLSPYQVKTQEEVTRSGGLYWVIKDFNSFMIHYKSILSGLKEV